MDKSKKIEEVLSVLSDKMKEAEKKMSQDQIDTFNAFLGIFKCIHINTHINE